MRFPDISDVTGPAIAAAAVVKSDTNAFREATRALYVGSAGDLVVTMFDDSTVTFKNVQSGSLLPIRVKQVKTASTAADIVALS